MNLWLRMLLVLLRVRFRSRIAVGEPSIVEFRNWPWDCDANLHMNNSRYASFMDLGRIDLLGRVGTLGTLRNAKVYPVVTAQHILYRRSLEPFAAFALRTEFLGTDDRSFYVRQTFTRSLRGSEQFVARGIVQAMFIGVDGRMSVEEVKALLAFSDLPSASSETAALFPPLPKEAR